jgi:predicted  nucleic acid-binding Zn-ribbon protein
VLRELFDFVHAQLLLAREVQELRESVKELRLNDQRVEARIEELARQLQEERHEREKLALKLDNTLMRFERRLPPGRGAAEQ